MPKGRPPGSRNKLRENPKPRKPYTSTKRSKCVAKEDLLDRLKREVSEQALAIIPCDSFEAWLASYAAHEGNDYIRRDQHEHTYNSTHHRVVTYGCNHTSRIARRKPEESANEKEIDDNVAEDTHTHYDSLDCDAILDVYFFYESKVYQIIKLGEHAHKPTNVPINMVRTFAQIPGMTGAPSA